MPNNETSPPHAADMRENVARIFDQCAALLASVEPHLEVARHTIAFVDRQMAELKPLIDNLGIHTGPLADIRTKLAALTKQTNHQPSKEIHR